MTERFPSYPINQNEALRAFHRRNIPALGDPEPPADSHGNRVRREGVDRCPCGCKYWENDRCVDCGGTEPESEPCANWRHVAEGEHETRSTCAPLVDEPDTTIRPLEKLKNGYTVLAVRSYEAPGVFCVLATDGHEFATWIGTNTENTFWGHYFDSVVAASQDWESR